ncbi:MAG: hypothetical protein KGZ69_17270 [Methylomonas sp.]|nr:hypothetical protein [Methylomonas sp.]
MINAFLNPLLIALGSAAAYFLSIPIGGLHCRLTGECSAVYASIGFTPYIGLILGYVFFVTFLLIGIGNQKKFWWLMFFVGPVIAWPVYESNYEVASEFLIVIVFALLVGVVLNKAITKLAPTFMAKLR